MPTTLEEMSDIVDELQEAALLFPGGCKEMKVWWYTCDIPMMSSFYHVIILSCDDVIIILWCHMMIDDVIYDISSSNIVFLFQEELPLYKSLEQKIDLMNECILVSCACTYCNIHMHVHECTHM